MKININKPINKFFLSLLITFLCALLIFLLNIFNFFDFIQNPLYDSFFKIKSQVSFLNDKDKTITDQVVIAAIDENSIEIMDKQKSLSWPWPRDIYGYIAEHLINQGAKAVVFDIIFSGPDLDREGYSSGEENDLFFTEVIKSTNKVIIPFNIDESYIRDDQLEVIQIKNADKFKNIKEYKYLMAPYNLYTDNNINLGFVDTKPDQGGIIRKYYPFLKIKNKYYPSLASSIYLLTKDQNLPDDLQINKNGQFRLKWYGPGGIDETFKYISFIKILIDYSNYKKGTDLQLPKDAFKDKVVFIGASARGLTDMKITPFSSANEQDFPGVEIHATSYLNLANNDWMKTLPIYYEFLAYFILLLILVYFALDVKNILKYSIIFLSILFVIIIIHFFLFSMFNIIFYTASLVIMFFLTTYITAMVLNYIMVGHARSMIKNSFSTYLSPDLLKKISESDKPLSTSGENIIASAIFIDIQGFTTFSEKNPVEKVVETLNLYLRRFSDAIINNNGFINKYLGDGLMGLFGTPQNYNEHADMAVKSAFECYNINQELAKDFGLNVRIGVNSGSMIAGNLGGGKKLEFTAIGDSVNTASRLEGANKFFSTRILTGENTIKLLKNKYDLNYLGKFSLKGKDIPYGIYYFTEQTEDTKKNFELLINAYEANDKDYFKKYMDYFTSNKIDFGPVNFYLNYLETHEKKFGQPIKLTEK